ncbi:small polypeptide ROTUNDIFOLIA LIKE 3 [Ziziphus jujuba]|uniref:Small polypeptide ROTUNDIFOLIA LIKE 3 n=1 Tax=Ziziphus jujuba TaxID=326968 RepID=A0A6P4APW6_ZIZJJ|nr:small polypeptide ROTUNDIFOLIA LIKE 3 [Ziziphus jujuba]
MAAKESNTSITNDDHHHHHNHHHHNHHHQQQQLQQGCEPCRSFGQKCSHLVKKQRAKFYILRRCIAMLVCSHERGEP